MERLKTIKPRPWFKPKNYLLLSCLNGVTGVTDDISNEKS